MRLGLHRREGDRSLSARRLCLPGGRLALRARCHASRTSRPPTPRPRTSPRSRPSSTPWPRGTTTRSSRCAWGSHLASTPSGSIDALRYVVTNKLKLITHAGFLLPQKVGCKICLQALRLGRDHAAAGPQAVRADQQPGARPDPRLRRRERAVRHAHDPARRVLAPRARRAVQLQRHVAVRVHGRHLCVPGQRGPHDPAADRPGQRLLGRGEHDDRLRLLPRVAVLRARRVHGGLVPARQRAHSATPSTSRSPRTCASRRSTSSPRRCSRGTRAAPRSACRCWEAESARR